MIGVSKWKYSQSAIDERQDACNDFGDPSDFCKNEAWFIRELSQQLQEKFEIQRNLTFAFMDSFSQFGPNLYDEVQQSHWIEETNKLWSEATSRNETFDFKTIDDVLEENALCKEENNWLNDVISEDIKQLKENITSLDNKIIRNGEKITDNQSSMLLLTKDVEDLQEEVDGVSTRGHWCSFKNEWNAEGTVTYDYLTFSDSNNMDYGETPMNINSGITVTSVVII